MELRHVLAVASCTSYETAERTAPDSGTPIEPAPPDAGAPLPSACELTDVSKDPEHCGRSACPNGAVYRAAKAGGDVTTIASALADPTGLALDTAAVYWTERTTGVVRKIAKPL